MTIRWGVLGTANIAKGCTIPGMKAAGNCELYAVAGRNKEKAESYRDEFGFEKAYTGYEALLADPMIQAVYIPLPNHLHKEWVVRALRAGKHVLCEKPLGLNAGEVREMHAEAKKNGVILMEAYAYLHSPYIASLKADIKSGIIGTVDYLETAFVTQGYIENIRIHKEMGGGAMYDLGCYCTTLALTLIDSDPDMVMCIAEFDDNRVDIFDGALIRFRNSARAAFNVGMIFEPGSDARQDRLYIHGTKGYIRSDVEYNQAGTLSYTVTTGNQTVTRTTEVRSNYALEIEQLGRCIENGETPYVTEEFSIRNAELLDRLLRSMGY